MTILAATDLSEQSRRALVLAAWTARRRGHALRVLHVGEQRGQPREWRDLLSAVGQVGALADVESRAREALGPRLEAFCEAALAESPDQLRLTRAVRVGEPADEILVEAAEVGARMIFCGLTGRGAFRELLVGSTTSRLVRESDVPVCMVPRAAEAAGVRTILAPVDLSDCSLQSLRMALELARDLTARVVLLHALTLPDVRVHDEMSVIVDRESEQQARRRRMEEVATFLHDAGVGRDAFADVDLQRGPADEAILESAHRHGADLVCMGTHGHRGLHKLFLGSTTEKVLRRSSVPVLTVRAESGGER
ncbi:MAG: universal stress protein [Myxococcota bacterium]